MTTGELLSSHSSVSNVSALTHLMNITGGGEDQYVDYMEAQLQEELFKAEIVDTLIGTQVEEVLEAVLVEEGLTADLVEEITGVQQC